VSFTLQTYTHVIPTMDEQAADAAAAFILGGSGAAERGVRNVVRTGSNLGKKENWPGTKSQASGGSGGRI
jgi:hypothetical protein